MNTSGITGRTQVCAVIGDPIEHTMSPAMHNAAFDKLRLDYAYLAFRVTPENLPRAIGAVRALSIRGLNVTIPHKVAVMSLLDKVDPVAEKIGAVNTIVNKGGKLTGHNTDAPGFLQALQSRGVDPAGKRVVVLGAGGAARAVCYALAERGAALDILNRELELDWAEDLAHWLSEVFRHRARAHVLDETVLSLVLEDADILVNTTSVGMSPEAGKTPVPARLLRPGLVVFDAVYNPLTTRLLAEAGAAGASVISGIDMLAWQGALAFKLWTGKTAPVELMRDAAIKEMSGK